MAEPAKTGTNGNDPEVVRAIVAKIDACFNSLLSERGAYMNRCRGIRQGITAAYAEAKEAGIKTKELRVLIKNRERERKIEDSILELEADEQENYDMLVKALGDFGETDLGKAALAKGKAATEPNTLDSMRE